MKRVFAVFLVAALLCGNAPLTAGAAGPVDITADFTDPLFLEAVYSRVLRKPATEPIYDTDVAEVLGVHVSGIGIQSLAGLEHFTGMKYLSCDDNRLTSLPALPETLLSLDCARNYLTALPTLPAGLETLYCDYNRLGTLPALPASLNLLFCKNNGMTALPALPPPLTELHCENNSLSALPALPFGLKRLVCANNKLTGFDITGLSLVFLDCRNNSIVDEHNVTGFRGMWVELEDLWRPEPAFYYYPQNVVQQNTNCEHGHHLIWCISESSFAFTGDNDPAIYGPVQYQVCKNRCGKVINHKNYTSTLGVLYRNNLTLPPPAADMAGLNFRYVVTKGGEHIEVVERGGNWEIRSKKHFLKNTNANMHEISVVSDLGSFVVAEVYVYLRWFTWDWFKTYFLFGWIWF